MSLDTISYRVSVQNMQQKAEKMFGEKATLVVPYGKPNQKVLISRLTSTKWFQTFKKYIQLGVDAGIFGKASTEQMISWLFREARGGWCLGFTECISADRSPRVPIEQTVKTMLSSLERPLMVQICYMIHTSVKKSLSIHRLARRYLRKAAKKGETFIAKRPLCMQKILRKTLAFCEKKGISDYSDPRLAEKRYQIAAKVGPVHTCKRIPLDTVEKERCAEELKIKLSDLMSEILDGNRRSPMKKIYCSQINNAKIWKKFLPRAREMQLIWPGHILPVIRQGKKYYVFQQTVGLVKLSDRPRLQTKSLQCVRFFGR